MSPPPRIKARLLPLQKKDITKPCIVDFWYFMALSRAVVSKMFENMIIFFTEKVFLKSYETVTTINYLKKDESQYMHGLFCTKC